MPFGALNEEDERSQMQRMAALQQKQRPGQPSSLQMTPPVPGNSASMQSARPPITPNMPGNQVPPANPALQQQPQPQQQADPELGRSIAKESAEAVKTASTKDKKQITKEMESTFGKGSVEKSYKQAIERLGGEKVFDAKLSKEDWGLFLLDFGMRMMAASSKSGASFLGAAGEAGGPALQGMMGRETAEKTSIDEYNTQLRSEARDLTEMEMDQGALATDAGNILWTDKGAYNMSTGKYEKGPGGGVLQAGQEPGSGNQQYAAQIATTAISDSLIAGGVPEGDARSLAQRMAHGGAPDPGEYYTEVARQFDKMQEKAGLRDVVPGTNTKLQKATAADKDRWVRQQVTQYMQFMTGEGNPNKPALAEDGTTKPGPGSEDRQPSNWNKF